MGRIIPLDEMQSMGELLPRSIITVDGKELESRTTKTGKLSYNTRSEIVEPADLAGQSFFDNFTIGSDADPDAEQKATWNGFGGKRFRTMLEMSGIELGPRDDEELAAEWIGQRYQVFVTLTKQPERNKDGSENPYGGQEQNGAKGYYLAGTHEARLLDDGEMPATVRRAPAAPTAAKAAPAAKATKAAPAAAKAGNGAAQPAKAAKPATSREMKCSMCNKDIPVAGFAQHVEEAHPEE